MAKIRITPETLEGQAKTLGNYKTNHETNYGQIKQLVNSLVQEWEGPAQQAFVQTFTQRDAEFQKFSADIEKFIQLMNTAAREMRATEESLTQKVNTTF